MKKTSVLIIATVLIMLISSCQPAISKTPNEGDAALPVSANGNSDGEWVSTTIVTSESSVYNGNSSEDGYNGREIPNSEIVVDNDTRWTVRIKIENSSETKGIESTGVILAGNNHDYNEIDLFLGVTGTDWKIGYAPKLASGYEFFENLGPLSGLEQEFQITISSDGKLLELSNESQVIFSRELTTPWFPSSVIVNANIQNGPHSAVTVSNLIVDKKAGEADGYAVAEVFRPSLPAPEVPAVSAPISVENVSQLSRLTSLGWGDLVGMSLSPDEKYLAVNSSTGIVILDATFLKQVIFLPTEMKDYEVQFLENGRISARDCFQGYIWSLPEGELLKHVHFQKTDPKIAFYEPYCQSTPDTEMEYAFIHGAADQPSGLYQLSTASPVYTLDFSPSQVVVSPDGKLIALNGGDKLVVLNYADGTVLQELAETGVKWLFFYPDSSIVAAVYENQTKFWNTESFELLDTVPGTGLGSILLSYPEFSPDGSVLVFRINEVYRFYRSSDRALINGITGFGIKFATDSQGVFVDNGNGAINYFSFNDDRSKMDLEYSVPGKGIGPFVNYMHQKISESVALSSDNSKFLSIETTGRLYSDYLKTILVYDIPSASTARIDIEPYVNYFDMVDALWLPKKNSFMILMMKSNVTHGMYLLDMETKTINQVVGETPYAFNMAMSFSPASDLLVYAHGNELVAWDIKNSGYWPVGFDPSELTVYYANQPSISFSPDGMTFTFADALDVNRTFNTPDYSQLNLSSGGGFAYWTKSAASPDGSYLAWVSGDWPAVKVSLVENNKSDVIYELETGFDIDFAFSTDSKMIAISNSSTSSNSVSVYDLSTREVIFTTGGYLCEGDTAPRVAFSPDGNYLAILPKVGYPQLWGIR